MNHWMFEQVNDFAAATPWLHGIARAYADYGVILFAALLVAGWWIGRRSGDVRRVAAAIAAGGDSVNEARPYTAMPHILVLADRSTDPSFPSDHATMAGAVAVGLWFVSRRLGIVAAVAAVLMAFTRVYIAAHYPADVAAGLLLGGLVAGLVWLLVRRPLIHVLEALERTWLRFALTASPHARMS